MRQQGVYARMRQKQGGFVVPVGDGVAHVDPERLGTVPILEELSAELRREIAPLFATESFPEGRIIVHQGDPGDKFYLIARGKAEVFRDGSGGAGGSVAHETLAILGDGDYFGEIALLENTRRTAHVRAVAPSVCLVLHRGHFLELMERFPGMQQRIREVAENRKLALGRMD
jgi:ATP-binding cassette subfamily B protein